MSDREIRYSIDRRIRFLQFIVLLTVSLLVMSLFFFQVIKANEYVRLASQNRLRIIRMAPPRGTITDSKGAPRGQREDVQCQRISRRPTEGREHQASLLHPDKERHTDRRRGTQKADRKQYSAPYRAITVASNLTFAQAAELITDKDFSEALFLTPCGRGHIRQGTSRLTWSAMLPR